MKDTNTTKKVMNFLSFASLIIVAILIFIEQLLPMVGVIVHGRLFQVLATIKDVFVIIVIGVSAYRFVIGKGKVLNILFWIAVALFITAVILRWFI